ncbi:UNVERIFIED_CONTAM: E3 ubiquitin-protein ligase CHIP [Sesamum latifolium]|uniref:E3 ubiquitin-protein ligase CHIP n=1 Tax=Sesamum latifolium TaxID=2727402 RepID=A0AAW2Y3Y5_9LAMI
MSPTVAASAAEKQAEQLRQDGNSYFKKDRFGAAIDAYTEAIALCPNVPIYWTNRALCHRKRNEWARVEEDCRRAIQLDHHSVKAHYMLGLALLQRKNMQKVLGNWKRFCGRNAKSTLDQLEALDRVFNKAAEDDSPTEVPDYLCCKITLDIFRDPVITPSGVTYERAVILDHLQKVGKFDPITRDPLYPSQLVPNLAIKEAVTAYLDVHGVELKCFCLKLNHYCVNVSSGNLILVDQNRSSERITFTGAQNQECEGYYTTWNV